MPYDKLKLAEMTATNEEYIDKSEIAERLGVTKRTVERLIEEYARKLRKSRRRQGRKMIYLWADILRYAKIHTGIEKENIPSPSIKKAYTKQRIQELEAENKRLRESLDCQQTAEDMEPPF